MLHLNNLWSPIAMVIAAFLMGWAAETAQTFIPRALALSLLAWLQTLPEFAVESVIAWRGQRDLMIANLTGSLRLLVGLGWPMVFFTHFVFHAWREGELTWSIDLDDEDSLGILALLASIFYFVVIWAKGSLTCIDSAILIAIYSVYLICCLRLPIRHAEEIDDLPWIGRQIAALPAAPRIFSVSALFIGSGALLYFATSPFIETLQRFAVALGMSVFVFIQWVAPFLSEFPEKVSAFN